MKELYYLDPPKLAVKIRHCVCYTGTNVDANVSGEA